MARRRTTAREIPMAVRLRIDAQRRRLQRGRAVLAALEFSASHDAEDVDAGEVASLVVDVLDDAIEQLDSVHLLALAREQGGQANRQRRR